MRYRSFRITNFKGIRDTTVSFQTLAGASVFAFVGLNESGKTTVLEAIHSFSPDEAMSELIGADREIEVPVNQRVPRHLLSSFSGNVSVTATLVLDEEDKVKIREKCLSSAGLMINPANFPDEIKLERQDRFKDGDHLKSYFSLRTALLVKGAKQKKYREYTLEEREKIKMIIYRETPDICYFPTFVFDFPDRIYLTSATRGETNSFYKGVFQDILDFDGNKYTIDKDITRRIRSPNLAVPWINFLGIWKTESEQDKIQHVMDRASATVSKVVFGRWNRIFGEDARGKEIIVAQDLAEGEAKDKSGAVSKTNQHDIYIRFLIKDGTRRFNVNDRSLGFRWFFAFMLFTQFRAARSQSRPMLFLFDEPASNLHAAAQQKLIDCFPEIARGQHTLAYTTHSHYMIEPKWLEQTYIVTNRADSPSDSLLDEVSLDDESLDIKVHTYRDFVNRHPSQTDYFQPILDRLEVVPSRFDYSKKGIVLEGKSDYYILRYCAKLLEKPELPLVPGVGAGTFAAIAAIQVGWNLNLHFVLDSDKQGQSERERYIRDFGIIEGRIHTLGDLVKGLQTIESLIDAECSDKIRAKLGISDAITKAHIRRYFQEQLASNVVEDLGMWFRLKAAQLISALEKLTEE